MSKDLSGGQRQRLAVAIALVNDPEVVFLDEPTTGLDPQARRSMWDVIAALRGRGKTVFLTTHYMEEAERLCDWIAVVDHGKIIAEGTPAGLIRANFEHSALEFGRDERLVDDELRALPGAEELRAENGSTILYSSNPPRTTAALMALAEQRGAELTGFALRGATLEDVFLKLTGRRIRD
ncbi:MAG TPA: AAA family ATPase, partial [Herpetosiphonaceae bacterium]